MVPREAGGSEDRPAVRPVENDFRVGPYLVRPDRNLVERAGATISVQPKVMRLLCVLAACEGRTLSRSELLESVWDGTIVSNAAIDRAVCQLRKALGDAARSPCFVETVQKRGVRLMVAVEPAKPAAPPPYRERSAPAPAKAGLRGLVSRGRLIAMAVGLAVLPAASTLIDAPRPVTGASILAGGGDVAPGWPVALLPLP